MMTMPHLMNCQHSEDGWCLECVKGIEKERERLFDLNECLEKLLVCYRLGKHPSDKLLDKIDRLKK